MTIVAQDKGKFRRVFMHPDTHEFIMELNRKLKGKVDQDTIKQIAVAKGIKYMPVNYQLKSRTGLKNHDTRLETFENPIIDAIIRQKNRLEQLAKEQKKDFYEKYLEFGTMLLRQELENEIEDPHFLFNLFKHQIPESDTHTLSKVNKGISKVGMVEVYLGEDLNGEPVYLIFNDKNNAGFHAGIIGTTGSGKSQLALRIGSQIIHQSPMTNLIFLDYAKGDIANNKKFINDISARVIQVKRDGLPFNPFNLDDTSNSKIDELKDILCSNQGHIGSNQRVELYEVLRRLYDEGPVTDVYMAYERIKDFYEEQGRGINGIVELFHKLCIDALLPTIDAKGLYRSFLNDNLIINLAGIDDSKGIKQLIAFFVLHRIYSDVIPLGDSTIDPNTGMQEIRTVIFIDEAHNYMKVKNPILEKMLRELRSFGVSVIMMSQNYEDFHSAKGLDYTTLMNWVFFMKQKITEREIANGLDIPASVAKEMPNLSTIPQHSFYVKALRDKDEYVTFVQGESYNKGSKST